MSQIDTLRYPIGPGHHPKGLNRAQRLDHIKTLAELPGLLSSVVEPLDDDQLDTPYRPGGWTVRQVVHHLADSHTNAYIRIRLALTEKEPTIKPYEEKRWAELPDASSMPVSVSLNLLNGLHRRLVALLRALSDDQFERTLLHPENGVMTIDQMVSMYAWHSLHHVAHITSLIDRKSW
ncbi:MAG: bacillithiol transferase BstA [Bacteroidia bacterium]|nr:bacillithiol transferase BstA [Bacteroidia bacterium]